ncbi:probable G-protein coupled receptor 139 [Heterodontus francisci]|uniref:probable G-protein coupled receptor 139 n=1 Tax=Heterodontus francisci TaxID=7792 RepID=UPI00355BAB01
MNETQISIHKIYFTTLAVLGVPVNLLAIVILSRGKCGLSTCTTRYLVAMATADLLFIITEVILRRLNYYYFRGSFLNITSVCSVINVLLCAATDCSVWFTVTFTFDRFVAICCQKLKTKYCTEKTAAVVLATTCILLCLVNIPVYFVYEPVKIIDHVPWECAVKPSYFTEPAWVGFDWFGPILTPLLPFALILLLNALTVRHILVASRVRKGLRGQSKGENHSDPEMESRRKSVILLFTISGSFIFLWLVRVVDFLYYKITGKLPDSFTDSEYIFREVGFMLRALSCCTNTFIYVVTQSMFREQEVEKVVEVKQQESRRQDRGRVSHPYLSTARYIFTRDNPHKTAQAAMQLKDYQSKKEKYSKFRHKCYKDRELGKKQVQQICQLAQKRSKRTPTSDPIPKLTMGMVGNGFILL